MTKQEFYQSWIMAFVGEISDLKKLEELYDKVKETWMKEWSLL